MILFSMRNRPITPDPLVIPGLCVNARWYEPPEESLGIARQPPVARNIREFLHPKYGMIAVVATSYNFICSIFRRLVFWSNQQSTLRTNWPKIFVSEMRIQELPSDAAEILFRLPVFQLAMAQKSYVFFHGHWLLFLMAKSTNHPGFSMGFSIFFWIFSRSHLVSSKVTTSEATWTASTSRAAPRRRWAAASRWRSCWRRRPGTPAWRRCALDRPSLWSSIAFQQVFLVQIWYVMIQSRSKKG